MFAASLSDYATSRTTREIIVFTSSNDVCVLTDYFRTITVVALPLAELISQHPPPPFRHV